MSERTEKAVRLFREGYNCSQAVFAAFSDMYGIDTETALRISSSFGGGMGRMREVCGAVSGMFMVAGLETGAVDGKDGEGKQHNYQVVQQLAATYKKRNGSIICRELLGLDQKEYKDTKPEERTTTYYKKRPCEQLVADAAAIIEEQLLKAKQVKEPIEFLRVQTKEQVVLLANIADEVWHEFFVTILSAEQIDYMVDNFQSESAMLNQMQTEGYQYFLLKQGSQVIGYTGIKPEKEMLFLSKLYLRKQYRGQGSSSEVFAFLEGVCKQLGLNKIYLTVNKYNTHTIEVYKHRGFKVVKSQVVDIGQGYVMDDYVMELTLTVKENDEVL